MKANVAKKVAGLVLLFTLLMIATVSFCSMQWTYIYECENSLEDVSTWLTKKLDFYADMTTYDDGYCGIEAQLQKLGDDGETWSNVDDKFYEVYAEGHFGSIDTIVKVGKAGTYRFEILNTAYASNGMALESAVTYTRTVTIY